MEHVDYMRVALIEANSAYEHEEVPIGAVIVYQSQIIARAHNLRETHKSPIAHAEINAMHLAAQHLDSWNLSACTLYVTVEPCPMCAGAILQSQVGTVVYGLSEPNSGSFGSVVNLANEGFNHKPILIAGVLAEESRKLMQSFFKQRREQMVKVKALNESQLDAYFAIRIKVFVEEQNVSLEEEYDDYDTLNHPEVTHVGAFINDTMVGTMRLIKKQDVLKVGRLAVLIENRKDGVGSAFLSYAQKQAENNGFKSIELGAQVAAMPFYEKNGYTAYGEVFLDAEIDHKMMRKEIPKR